MNVMSSWLAVIAVSAGLIHPVSRAWSADGDDDQPGPSLTLPDGPTIPMPPGAEVFGPNGPAGDLLPSLPDNGLPPGKRQSQSTPEAAKPSMTAEERRKARIDDLFTRLGQAQDETEASAITAMLDRLWLQSGSDTADLLMSRAVSAMAANDYKLAESLLDAVVALQPGWAEAWNKRATVHYLDDDDPASMEDISHVLALEPRHFGALSGMGYILHRNGDDKDALTVLRKAAVINPQNKDLKTLIDQLTPDVEGHDL